MYNNKTCVCYQKFIITTQVVSVERELHCSHQVRMIHSLDINIIIIAYTYLKRFWVMFASLTF